MLCLGECQYDQVLDQPQEFDFSEHPFRVSLPLIKQKLELVPPLGDKLANAVIQGKWNSNVPFQFSGKNQTIKTQPFTVLFSLKL